MAKKDEEKEVEEEVVEEPPQEEPVEDEILIGVPYTDADGRIWVWVEKSGASDPIKKYL